ncbi:GNAT family N-acetyltransferase [Streptococcus thoraltensis]|uniref:GNAT family N-acetyltransferase n=1 Tax=Streptococcus thoraltensis TaxID=55085 RepID=UPI00037D0AE7|nr:GNAT family N-acetyltransferase [Streptococcus thoraltensis]MDY4762164.1 GNAT family N-acetyltransferase [Streptococcus thoraltensis]
MIDFQSLSKNYEIRLLTESDSQDVLQLYNTNPYYFKHCPPVPTLASVHMDMTKLPPNIKPKNKYFLGYFDKAKLIAALDLVEGYPDLHTAFIGLFMLDREYQSRGIGSRLIKEAVFQLVQSFDRVRLGYVATNEVAANFWTKQGFVPTGETSKTDCYEIILADFLGDKKDKQ